MKKTVFIKNALILTISSLLLRFIGIIFKVWLAKEIGSEGIGLYQLIFSVYVLISTFATSGISTAVTKLCAEELALGSKKGTLKILKRAIAISLFLAFVSLSIVFFGADIIAKTLIGDKRAVLALKILPFSLPFMAISSCIRGYFIARRKATPGSATQILEQLVRIGVIFLLISKFAKRGIAFCCCAVIIGDVLAEGVSTICLAIVYKLDQRKLSSLKGRALPNYKISKRIINIALPITSGRYLNSLLRTAENILVPKNLSKFSANSSLALSQFGMIKGMALPLLFFPSTLLNSVSILLIPEMSEALARKRKGMVKWSVRNILRLTAIISFIFASIFFFAGEEIGQLIYKEKETGLLIKYLAPIVPLMYLDSISDGLLKGLDQQNFTFRTAVSDSTLRIILILLILPLFGMRGFIGIMYFSNALTCFLNVGRLLKVSGARFKISEDIIFPLLLSITLGLLSNFLLSFNNFGNLVYIILVCLICLPFYLLLLFLFGTINSKEIKSLFS